MRHCVAETGPSRPATAEEQSLHGCATMVPGCGGILVDERKPSAEYPYEIEPQWRCAACGEVYIQLSSTFLVGKRPEKS